MKLELSRFSLAADHTLGLLYINGIFQCFTLEDTVRDIMHGEQKVYGETAIPAGVYEVVIDLSNRFKVILPRLLDVPQFSGIRIHPGNTAKDSHGCILVGEQCRKGFVGDSRKAMTKLMNKLIEANEIIILEVS